VYAEVRERILDGRLAPGTAINQDQLSGELGVSTTPLREAVQRLETEGFIRVVAHRDAIVAPLDVEEVVALYEVREQLDAYAVRLAARHHDEEDRGSIERAVRELAKARGDALRQNREFHAAIYRASHNPVLIALLDGLWDRADRYRRLVGRLASEEHVAEEHRQLAQAVLERREDDAADLLARHLRGAREEIERRVVELTDGA
jgi:DNA-binding GntR family transcriptional regulator